MRSWQIHIPHRTRSDSLIQVAANARQLEDADDRAVTRRLALDAAEDGLTSAGELLDRIERADPAERRAMLDTARVGAGLDTVSDTVAHRRFVEANDLARRPRRVSDEPLRLIAGGAIVPPPDPAELEREKRRDRDRAEALRERQEQRQREAEATRLAAERFRRENADNPYYFPPIAGVPQSRIRP